MIPRKAQEKITYVFLESLGICSECKQLISFTEIPENVRGPFYNCPLCHELMWPGETWGYGVPPGGDEHHDYQQLKWVGPGSKWVRKRPRKDFTLSKFRVLVNVSLMGKRFGKKFRTKK